MNDRGWSRNKIVRGLGPGRWAWVSDSLLFLSSFVILFIALALRFESPAWLRWVCIGLAGAGIVSAIYVLGIQRLLTTDIAVIETIDDRGNDVGGYLATYLLPLIVIGTPTLNDILAYALVFAAIGIVYVRSRSIQINPTLYFVGYRLYYVTTEDGFGGYMLSKSKPAPGDRLCVVQRDRLLLDLG